MLRNSGTSWAVLEDLRELGAMQEVIWGLRVLNHFWLCRHAPKHQCFESDACSCCKPVERVKYLCGVREFRKVTFRGRRESSSSPVLKWEKIQEELEWPAWIKKCQILLMLKRRNQHEHVKLAMCKEKDRFFFFIHGSPKVASSG